MYSRFSFTALGLPGRLTMRVLPRSTLAARLLSLIHIFATTVYQLWRTNDEAGAMQWVLVDIVISAVVLLAVNLLERRQKQGGKRT